MSDLTNKFEQLDSGKLSTKEFMAELGSGCVFVETAVREPRFVAGKPVEHWIKDCKEVHSCKDPSENKAKTCGAWRKEW